MADTDVHFVVSANTSDAEGKFQATSRQLKQVERDADKARSSFEKMGEQLDLINKIEAAGDIDPGTAAAARQQARARAFQQSGVGQVAMSIPGVGGLARAGAQGPLMLAFAALTGAIKLLSDQMARTLALEERGLAAGIDPNEIRRMQAIADRLGITPRNIPVEGLARRTLASGRTLQEEFAMIVQQARAVGPDPQLQAAVLRAQLGEGGAVLGGAALQAGMTQAEIAAVRPAGGDIPPGQFGGARQRQRIIGNVFRFFGGRLDNLLLAPPSRIPLERAGRRTREGEPGEPEGIGRFGLPGVMSMFVDVIAQGIKKAGLVLDFEAVANEAD